MTRLRAFAVHLTASILILLLFLMIMLLVWYPAPYFKINGGWKVLRILAGVDVVLGPLLTLLTLNRHGSAAGRSPTTQEPQAAPGIALFGVLMEGQKNLEFRPEPYHPYRPDPQQLRSRSIDLSKIAALSTDAKRAVDAFVAARADGLRIICTCLSEVNTRTSSWRRRPRTACRWVRSPSARGWRIIERAMRSEESFRRDFQRLLRPWLRPISTSLPLT